MPKTIENPFVWSIFGLVLSLKRLRFDIRCARGFFFGIRKDVFDYDQVLDQQRQARQALKHIKTLCRLVGDLQSEAQGLVGRRS